DQAGLTAAHRANYSPNYRSSSSRSRSSTSAVAALVRNHGQDQAGGVPAIMIDDLVGFAKDGLVGDGAAGVGVAVKAREIAARYLQPHAMAFQKDVAGDSGVDVQLVDLTGDGELRF